MTTDSVGIGTATVVTSGPVVAEPLLAILAQQERTLAWLARKTGKSPSYVTRVIQGERRPSEVFKAKASEVLGVPVDLIFPPITEDA